MTVQELLKSVSFDEIAEALQRTHFRDEENFIGSSAEYKEAYDQLCNIIPDGAGGEVTFDVTPRENRNKPKCLPVVANNVEGDHWENIVKKIVVKPSPNPFTDAELAGAILWGSTFYGFTDQTMGLCLNRFLNEAPSPYAIQAYRLDIREMLPYIRDKKERRDLKKLSEGQPDGVPLNCETMTFLWKRQKHLNRSKRKRAYRINNRIMRLWEMDKHYDILKRTSEFGKIERENYLKELTRKVYGAKKVHEIWLETFTYGKVSRIDYIRELLEKYCAEMRNVHYENDTVLIIAWASEQYPLSQDEREDLTTLLRDFYSDQTESVDIVFGTKSGDNAELQLQNILIDN